MLGPFQLIETLARGGTAVVWRARYADGRPGEVAVKVLMEERARDAADLSAFRSEVRAAARLVHPAIAGVLDYGEVTEEEAATVELPEGSPWLAMELGQGTLHSHCGRMPWPAMKEVLEQLLAALAHAHAHGLIHRDVKPRNLLRMDGGWKLADFGLAHVVDGTGDTRIIGTPSYMAPEHFAGAWRDHGPWTDLYSLGCLAWHLVCGVPPFSAAAGNPATLREAHQTWPVPSLRPQHPVPAGLEAWIRRLMAKQARDRPPLAADALCALQALGAPVSKRATPALLGPSEQEQATAELELETLPLPAPAPLSQAPWPRPRFSPNWHDDPRLPPPAGLGLLALRARPVIGRRDERDLIWQRLGEVVQEGELKIIALSGPVGVGASHLAHWLATESHARGLATPLRTHWSRGRGPDEGLAPTLTRAYTLYGLDPQAQRARLSRLLRAEGAEQPEQEAQVLLSILHPTPARRARFAAEEQRAALRRMLRRRAQDRAVLWVMDDAEHGPESLALLQLLRSDPALPALIVLPTKQPERFEGLVDLHIALGPLPESDVDALLRGVLGLSPELALQVQDRCQGNPAFALQLVEAWVDQSALQDTPQGLALAPDHRGELPESLASAWSRRLNRLLHRRPKADAKALELAALSGRSVHQAEWLRVCQKAGWAPSPDLLEALLRRELATTSGSQWRFAHAWLREALESRAKAQGHWPILHALLAADLAAAGPHRAGERGAHHLEAGDWQAALRDLSAGQAWLLDRGALARAALLEPLRVRALRAQNPPFEDPVRGQDLLLRARLAFGRGDAAQGQRLAKQAVQAARRHGWTLLEAQALLEGGRLLHRRGELSRAKRWLRRAVKAALSAGNRPLAGHCRELLASTLSELGEGEQAALTLQAAWEDYAASSDGVGVGSVHLGLSFLAMAQEALDDAEAHARVTLEHCTGVGAERMRCAAMTVLGDVCRARGEGQQAQEWFTRALRKHRSSGRLYAVAVTQLNLALTAIEAEDLQQAQGALRAVTRFQQGQGAGNLLALTWLAQAVCAARAEDPVAAVHLEQACVRLNRTGQVHRDLRVLAELLAQASAAAGWKALAQQATGLAHAQAQALGTP